MKNTIRLSIIVVMMVLAGCGSRRNTTHGRGLTLSSGFDDTNLTEQDFRNLETLGRVWGFVKYHHPAFESDTMDADVELFVMLFPEVVDAKAEKVNALLFKWIKSLGEYESDAESYEKYVEENRQDLIPYNGNWLADTSRLGAELSAELTNLRYAKRGTNRYYTTVSPNPFAEELAFCTSKDKLPLRIIRDGREMSIVAPAEVYRTDFNNYFPATFPESEDGYTMLADGIGYFHVEGLDANKLSAMYNALRDTGGMVIDLRGYPRTREIYQVLQSFLLDNMNRPYAVFSSYAQKYPGDFLYSVTRDWMVDNDNAYKGDIVVIVDSRTISAPEYITMILQGMDNVEVLGSQTAGADGNVVSFSLPGGISSRFSGLGVYYPDRESAQRVGVRIDHHVRQTTAGILAGRDELLLKAVEILQNKQ